MTYHVAPGTMDPIDLIVSNKFGCTISDLYDETRCKPQSTARQFAMFYRRSILKQRPCQISRHYKLTSGTVQYALRMVPFWIMHDRNFREVANECFISLKNVNMQ